MGVMMELIPQSDPVVKASSAPSRNTMAGKAAGIRNGSARSTIYTAMPMSDDTSFRTKAITSMVRVGSISLKPRSKSFIYSSMLMVFVGTYKRKHTASATITAVRISPVTTAKRIRIPMGIIKFHIFPLPSSETAVLWLYFALYSEKTCPVFSTL